MFDRAQCLARAYDLRLLPAINVYGSTSFSRAQCETLLEEIAFVASVTVYELLLQRLARMQEVIVACTRDVPLELRIVGP